MLPTIVFLIFSHGVPQADVYWQQPQKERPVEVGDCFVAVSATLIERVSCPCEAGRQCTNGNL
jgi:hypothetical protein